MKKLLLLILAILFISIAVKANFLDVVVVPDSIIIVPNSIIIKPDIILPGDPVLITVNSDSTPLVILWDNKDIPTFDYESKTRALLAIDFNEKILDHTVTVKLNNGETITRNIKITPREKIEKPLGIPEKLGGNTPRAATNLLNNLAKENLVLNTLKTSPTILWTKAFQYPLSTIFVTDDYGYDRQTVTQSIAHKGTDFRATIGTHVKAMNRGIVRIARPFTVYGNTVVIDHGLGVQTLYMHMSKLNVKEGDAVESGDVIGLSGDTGYAEAAHLHISVKINSVSIDPMTFLGFFSHAK